MHSFLHSNERSMITPSAPNLDDKLQRSLINVFHLQVNIRKKNNMTLCLFELHICKGWIYLKARNNADFYINMYVFCEQDKASSFSCLWKNLKVV